MALDPFTGIINLGTALIEKLIPDPEAKAKATVDLIRLQQSGELDGINARLSAIIAEAKSADPWTSRARPSFLYVIYILILSAIPMGILSAFNPDAAVRIAAGLQAWLGSIPDALWATFGVGYTGYTVARSAWDKKAPKG